MRYKVPYVRNVRFVMEALTPVKSMEIKRAVADSGSGLSPPRTREPSVEETKGAVIDFQQSSKVMKESRETIERLAQVMDDYVKSSQRSLKIQVDSRTGETIVKVISKEDGRTIREIPPEQLRALAAKMKEMMGFLFDEKV
ncbi:MAG: flagellar protein FlaG [Desulfobacteraceae bacterium]|nr:MAG: flagellar protein FlaG [Desulfobacteraceae bacterium]